jgi:hypothetical protein
MRRIHAIACETNRKPRSMSPNSEEQRNKETPLLAKSARNGGSDQMDRKPKQLECHPVLLESCHSFQAGIFGEPACIAQAGKGSVLIDSKNADGAATRIERVQIFAV